MASKEKSCSLRRCGDYRKLNAITLPDRYPISDNQDFTSQVHGAKSFQNLTSPSLQSYTRKFQTQEFEQRNVVQKQIDTFLIVKLFVDNCLKPVKLNESFEGFFFR